MKQSKWKEAKDGYDRSRKETYSSSSSCSVGSDGVLLVTERMERDSEIMIRGRWVGGEGRSRIRWEGVGGRERRELRTDKGESGEVRAGE